MKINLIVAVFLIVITSCHDEPGKMEPTVPHKADTVKAFLLRAAIVEKVVTLPGELLPYEVVEMHPKIPGYVKEIKVDIGSSVKKGQILAVIDAPEIESKLAESSSRMQSAKAKYEASRDTYERILIASKSNGVVSADELERARNQMYADSADYTAAGFSSKSNKQIGNYLVMVAPFTGTITERNVNEGAYVGGPNEKPILIIEDNSKLRLRVAVPEVLSNVTLKNHGVHFSTKSNPNLVYDGKLSRKSGNIDAGTRTEIWEFEISNENHTLKPGAFADVKLDVLRNEPSFAVPFSAVTTTLEKKFVTRVKNNLIEWVDVAQGLNQSDVTEVFGKLKEGDTLVLKGNEELKPGVIVVAELIK